MDLSALAGLVPAAIAIAHSAKVVALATLGFYIMGDAIATMIKERHYLDWRYATNYIRKFADVYLGLVVMAVMGQYIQALDLVFYGSILIYSKSELDGLMKKFGSIASAPTPAP